MQAASAIHPQTPWSTLQQTCGLPSPDPATVFLCSRLYRAEQRLECCCGPRFSLTDLAGVLRSHDKRLLVLEGNWL